LSLRFSLRAEELMLNFYKPQRLAVFALFFFSFLLFTTARVYSQYALQFDGSNDYVTFGAATSTLGASTFTLECWVKRSTGGVTMTTGSLGLDGNAGRPLAYPVLTKGMGEGETPANINMNWSMGGREFRRGIRLSMLGACPSIHRTECMY